MLHQKRQRVSICWRHIADGPVDVAHDARIARILCGIGEFTPLRCGDQRFAQIAQEILDAAAEHVHVDRVQWGYGFAAQKAFLRKVEWFLVNLKFRILKINDLYLKRLDILLGTGHSIDAHLVEAT